MYPYRSSLSLIYTHLVKGINFLPLWIDPECKFNQYSVAEAGIIITIYMQLLGVKKNLVPSTKAAWLKSPMELALTHIKKLSK